MHVVDQKLEMASDVTDEEEIKMLAPILIYLIYYGFEKNYMQPWSMRGLWTAQKHRICTRMH